MRLVNAVLDLGLLAAAAVFILLTIKAHEVHATGVAWDGPGSLNLVPARVTSVTPIEFSAFAVLCVLGIVLAHVLTPQRAGR